MSRHRSDGHRSGPPVQPAEPVKRVRERSAARKLRLARERRRRRWLIGCAAAAVVIAGLAVMALQLRSARADLTAAQRQVGAIQDAIAAGDTRAARSSMTSVQDAASHARSTMHQPQWDVVSHLPFVGDDIDAVQALTSALDDVGTGVLPSLVGLADQVNTGAFTPEDGVFDFAALRTTAGSLATAEDDFRGAIAPVTEIDPDDLVGPLRTPVREAQDKLERAGSALSRVAAVADILPDMTEGDHDYLVVFQNNAELRAQGGLPGAWAQLRIRDGKVSVGKQGAGSKTLTDTPVEQLAFSDVQAFRNDLGTDFRDTAFTPDTPTAARLQSKLVEKVWGVKTDGVVSLDPVTLSYLLRAVGPIKITDTLTLTSRNAVDVLLNRIYRLQPDPDKQDAFFALVTREMFERVADGSFDTAELAKGLVRGGEEGRLHVWSSDTSVETRLAATAVGGAVPSAADPPAIGLYVNDLTGAKMNYYLKLSSTIRSTGCTSDGVQSYEMKVYVASDAPPASTLPSYVLGAGRPPGSQTISLDVLGVAGGPRPVFTLGSKEQESASYQVQGRPGSRLPILVEPGDSAVITVTMASPKGQYGPTSFRQTPTITSGVIPGTIASSCLQIG